MTERPLPLGDYDPMSSWTGSPKQWGPEGWWRVWFAGGVIDGLVTVLDEHIAAVRSKYYRPNWPVQPAAIGCVPWLTSAAVVDRLLALGACCIVVDKGKLSYVPARLREADLGFPNVLPGLRERVPSADGTPLVVGPYTPREAVEHELGPVRVAGYRRAGRLMTPLLHAKLLVLGEVAFNDIGPGGDPTEELSFAPQSVWWGSANWTEAAPTHLEVGFWSDDTALVEAAADFMDDLLAFSEPTDTVTDSPEPNLLAIEYDEQAMEEAALASHYEEMEAAEQSRPVLLGSGNGQLRVRGGTCL